MKKLRILFAASAALAAVSALAFANNLVAIVRWWKTFLAAGGDSASVAAKMPGFVSWLDWTAVDYSAVTTFIPLLGFAAMAISLFRALHGRRLSVSDFPFFRGSDQLNVALGLFGTLWGIIVIGYFKLDTVTMADLMQCLHTALFSTLMAVVWVFMVDRPLLRPYCVKLLEKEGLAVAEGGDLSAAVEKLVVNLGEASEAFDRRQRAYEESSEKRQQAYEESFAKRQESYEEAFAKRQKSYEEAFGTRQRDSEETFGQRQKAFEDSFEKRLAAYEKEFDRRNAEYREFFLRRIAELESRAAASETRLKAVTDALRS